MSTGLCGRLTFGHGEFFFQSGYWEFPCLVCANDFRQKNPDMARKYGIWPSDGQDTEDASEDKAQ